MDPKKLLEILHVAQKLKDVTRHAYTTGGRHESVAEHSWRMCLTAMLVRDEFPDVNIDCVIRMCIVHDLGEIFTGDIPTFIKTQADTANEDRALATWVGAMPEPACGELKALFDEMKALETKEAKLYKAIDKLEAVIQHNESDLSTWLELEYDLNLTYADDAVAFSDYLVKLRELIRRETQEKIEQGRKCP